MKRVLVVAAIACVALALSGPAQADREDCAVAHVFVNVVPNISISATNSSVDLGTIQTGDFGSGVSFRIDANTEQVKFRAGVSQLFKGNVPTNPTVDPIDLKDNGVVMVAESAMPIGGHSSTAVYTSEGYKEIAGTGFPGRTTEWVTFESSQNNHFSQDITLYPTWYQGDPEKPIGEYSGVVALWAMVVSGGSDD